MRWEVEHLFPQLSSGILTAGMICLNCGRVARRSLIHVNKQHMAFLYYYSPIHHAESGTNSIVALRH